MAADIFLPLILQLVDSSLSEGKMPEKMKEAIILPLLKKRFLVIEVLKNYRPVSNLLYISKIIEKAVAEQLKKHLVLNKLDEPFQSTYKELHSTK